MSNVMGHTSSPSITTLLPQNNSRRLKNRCTQPSCVSDTVHYDGTGHSSQPHAPTNVETVSMFEPISAVKRVPTFKTPKRKSSLPQQISLSDDTTKQRDVLGTYSKSPASYSGNISFNSTIPCTPRSAKEFRISPLDSCTPVAATSPQRFNADNFSTPKFEPSLRSPVTRTQDIFPAHKERCFPHQQLVSPESFQSPLESTNQQTPVSINFVASPLHRLHLYVEQFTKQTVNEGSTPRLSDQNSSSLPPPTLAKITNFARKPLDPDFTLKLPELSDKNPLNHSTAAIATMPKNLASCHPFNAATFSAKEKTQDRFGRSVSLLDVPLSVQEETIFTFLDFCELSRMALTCRTYFSWMLDITQDVPSCAPVCKNHAGYSIIPCCTQAAKDMSCDSAAQLDDASLICLFQAVCATQNASNKGTKIHHLQLGTWYNKLSFCQRRGLRLAAERCGIRSISVDPAYYLCDCPNCKLFNKHSNAVLFRANDSTRRSQCRYIHQTIGAGVGSTLALPTGNLSALPIDVEGRFLQQYGSRDRTECVTARMASSSAILHTCGYTTCSPMHSCSNDYTTVHHCSRQPRGRRSDACSSFLNITPAWDAPENSTNLVNDAQRNSPNNAINDALVFEFEEGLRDLADPWPWIRLDAYRRPECSTEAPFAEGIDSPFSSGYNRVLTRQFSSSHFGMRGSQNNTVSSDARSGTFTAQEVFFGFQRMGAMSHGLTSNPASVTSSPLFFTDDENEEFPSFRPSETWSNTEADQEVFHLTSGFEPQTTRTAIVCPDAQNNDSRDFVAEYSDFLTRAATVSSNDAKNRLPHCVVALKTAKQHARHRFLWALCLACSCRARLERAAFSAMPGLLSTICDNGDESPKFLFNFNGLPNRLEFPCLLKISFGNTLDCRLIVPLLDFAGYPKLKEVALHGLLLRYTTLTPQFGREPLIVFGPQHILQPHQDDCCGQASALWLPAVYNGCVDELQGCGVYVSREYSYEGYFKNGRNHGWGLMVSKCGERYEGYWKEGRRHGEVGLRSMVLELNALLCYSYGVVLQADGKRLEGEWVNDVLDGRGSMETADGLRYEGEWRNGVLEGWGVLSRNGQLLAFGQFFKGQPHGWMRCRRQNCSNILTGNVEARPDETRREPALMPLAEQQLRRSQVHPTEVVTRTTLAAEEPNPEPLDDLTRAYGKQKADFTLDLRSSIVCPAIDDDYDITFELDSLVRTELQDFNEGRNKCGTLSDAKNVQNYSPCPANNHLTLLLKNPLWEGAWRFYSTSRSVSGEGEAPESGMQSCARELAHATRNTLPHYLALTKENLLHNDFIPSLQSPLPYLRPPIPDWVLPILERLNW